MARVAGVHAHLGLGRADTGVALQQPVRQVAPFHALADQRDLGGALDCHKILDEAADAIERAFLGRESGGGQEGS